MSEEPVLLVETQDGVATVTINRPGQRNAMNYEMLLEFPKVMSRLDEDDSVRVIILRGAGEEAFAAGADIKEFKERRSTPELAQHYNAVSEDAMTSIEAVKKPTIAMIYGYAMGGGTQTIACCDLRIAADTAKFGIPAAKLGLAIGLGYARRLTHLVGPAYAKEILFSARTYSAQQAKEMGLVNQVVAATDLSETVYGLARDMLKNAPLSVQSAKQSVNLVLTNPSLDGVDGHALFGWIFGSEDFAEGTRAFLEKRRPVFRGR